MVGELVEDAFWSTRHSLISLISEFSGCPAAQILTHIGYCRLAGDGVASVLRLIFSR